MWHLAACKISISFLNWIKNEMIFIVSLINVAMYDDHGTMSTLIQRYDNKSFYFSSSSRTRLAEILQGPVVQS